MIDIALDDYWREHAKDTADSKRLFRMIEQLRAYWKGSSVAEITRTTVKGYIEHRKTLRLNGNDRMQSAGNTTIRKELSVLISALNHEAEENRLTAVPQIDLPEAAPPKERWLTPEEFIMLLEACQTVHVYAYLMLAIYTGQRPNRIQSLKWFQVDFTHRLIDFTPNQKKNKKNSLALAHYYNRMFILSSSFNAFAKETA